MKKRSWTRRERKLLKERGGRASVEELSISLGRSPAGIRDALAEMGIASSAKAPAPREPLAERALFPILIALFVAVPLAWSPSAKDNFLLPQALLMITLSLAALCVRIAGFASTGELRIRRSPLYPIILLLGLSILPSCLHSANPRLTLDALAWYGACLLVFFLASSLPLTVPRARFITRVLVAVAAAEGAYGACQFFGWDPLFHAPDIARLKVFGTLGNPNFLSGFLAAVLPLALIAALGPAHPAARATAAISCALIAAGILVTGTKGSMLAAALSSGFILAYGLARRRLLGWSARGPVLLAGALLLAAGTVTAVSRSGAGAFSLPSAVFRSLDPRGLSVGKRLLYWKTSREMLRARPLAGWGPGTYRLHYLDSQARVLARPENSSFIPIAGNPLHAHNDYLEFWAESGPLALALFLFFMAAVVARGIRSASGGQSPGFALGILGGFVSLAVTALVCFPLHRASTALLFWAFAGMIAADPECARGWLRIRAPRPVAAVLLAASCASLLLTAGYAVTRLRAESWFAQACAASNAQRWRDASALYRRGLAFYPRDGEARLNLGMACYHLKEYDEAISALREGFREVRDFSGQVTLADALDEKGERARAVEEYRRALFLNPGDGRAMNNLGVCLSKQGKDAEALLIWERAAGLKTPNADSLANLAVTYCGKGNPAEARKWAELTLSSGASGDNEKKARFVMERVLTR